MVAAGRGPDAGRETMVVGVCTFNRGDAIRPTLDALAAMDRAGGRVSGVVVVDNASTDGTADAVRRFASAHPGAGLRLVSEPSPGKVNAMRRLFAETTDPIVAIVDDDCLPDARWAAAMLALADERPRAGVIGGEVLNVWESGPTRLARIYRRSLGDQILGDRRRLEGPREFLMGAAMACRRAAVEDSGWLRGAMLEGRTGAALECGAEDAEICIRVRRAGWEIWYEPAARMGHLIPARRQTAAYLARLRASICRGEPALWWVADRFDAAEAARQSRAARRRYIRTLLLDWRPTRRRIRLAERRGRAQGWSALAARLDSGEWTADPARRGASEP